MRYYELDPTGKVKGSYSVPQPDKHLYLLEDAPDSKSKRDTPVPGVVWMPDPDLVSIEDAALARLVARVQAMKDLKVLVMLHDADKAKLKIEDLLNRLHLIEILIDAR